MRDIKGTYQFTYGLKIKEGKREETFSTSASITRIKTPMKSRLHPRLCRNRMPVIDIMSINYFCFISCFIWLFLISWKVVEASIGDVEREFQVCLFKCQKGLCEANVPMETSYGFQISKSQPLSLSLLFWSCEDECKYECMCFASKLRQRNGKPIVKNKKT